MKKNKMITILLSFVAALASAGLAVSAAQTTDADKSALAESSYLDLETSIVIDESSATEPPPTRYSKKFVPRVYVTEEEKKAAASSLLKELNTEQDCNSGDAIQRKRARLIKRMQEEAKQDVVAYDIMEKYNSDFKQDIIITDEDKDIECMHSMVELLNKNIVTDSEKETLITYVERRIGWLDHKPELQQEFIQDIDNIK